MTLAVDRTEVLGAVETYLGTPRTLVVDESSKLFWPVYGLSVLDVLKIDPQKPFYEIRSEASNCQFNKSSTTSACRSRSGPMMSMTARKSN